MSEHPQRPLHPRSTQRRIRTGRPPSRLRATQTKSGSGRSVIVVVILLILSLVAIGATRWLFQQGLALAPTPTATTTKGPTETPTPDFRATQNIADLMTAQAYRSAQLGIDTPTPPPSPTPTGGPTATPTSEAITPEASATIYQVPLPIVVRPGALTPTPTPTLSPVPAAGAETTVEPTATPTATATPTLTPTATVIPTATPTLSTTPSVAAALNGVVQKATTVRMGPGSLYTTTVTILEGQNVRIEGRDSTGEWVYLCCQDNIDGWVRQAFLLLKDNLLPPGAPASADPNDVRWLVLRQPTVTPPSPVPTSTPISDDDYPLYRRDPGNQAWESTIVQPPLVYAWPDPGQAARAMSSPVVASGPGIYAASEDSRLYSFEKATGNQRWRYTLNRVVRMAPAVKGTTVYAVDMSGRVYALQDQGNQAGLIWQNDLGVAPSGGINLWGNMLYIPGANHHLYALDQSTGTVKWDYSTSGNYLHYPAIGNQLVYVGDGQLSALDTLDGTLIWTQDIPVGAPPVYASPGTIALAELYVADEFGNIYAFDANTGKQLWKSAGNTRADGLAVDSTAVYASGAGYVKALDRRDGSLLWEFPITVNVVGGPVVSGTRLVVAGQGGFVQIFDADIGVPIGNAIVPSQVMGAPAVTREWIFVPAGDGNLYALKGSG